MATGFPAVRTNLPAAKYKTDEQQKKSDEAKNSTIALTQRIVSQYTQQTDWAARAQDLLYLVQQGIIPIPRTANPQHQAANLAVFDFTLNEAEMKEIANLKQPDGRVVNPPHAPKWDA